VENLDEVGGFVDSIKNQDGSVHGLADGLPMYGKLFNNSTRFKMALPNCSAVVGK
jgi:hypothetical protein